MRGSVRDHTGAAPRYGSWADMPSPSDSLTRESDRVGASPRWGCKPALAKPSEVEDGGEIMTMAPPNLKATVADAMRGLVVTGNDLKNN